MGIKRNFVRGMILIAGGMVLASCAETQFIAHTAKSLSRGRPLDNSKVVYKIGRPYKINGVTYSPRVDYNYDETGIASWYGSKFHNRRTANGEIFDMNALTAAHRTLPLPSYVSVTNLSNGRSIVLKVNDRGPFVNNRIIDISRRGAQILGFLKQGTAMVRVRILAKESRALALRLGGGRRGGTYQGRGEVLTAANSPIKINRMPKPEVSHRTLPLPPGATAAAPPPAPKRVVRRGSDQAAAVVAPVKGGKMPDLGKVTQLSVRPAKIFIQAGAFSYFDTANRVRAKLNMLGGPVKITSVFVNGRDLFRVRIGPLNNVKEADFFLERAIGNGFVDSKIIILD